jgi:hypothetical protein
MRSTTPSRAQWCGSALLVTAAVTHLPLIREHLEEAPYVGWLFLALSVACLALAVVVLLVDHPVVWGLAALTCLAAAIGFFLSRTVGLPQIGDDVGNWTEPLGFPAVASEILLAVLAYAHLRSRRGEGFGPGRPANG